MPLEKIRPYNPHVQVIWATPNPTDVVTRACSITQKGVFAGEAVPNAALIQFLNSAEHGSPLEHTVISMDITQISRACADQLRTHRLCSPTMSSTHYQDHSDYTHRVDESFLYGPGAARRTFAIDRVMDVYKQALSLGMLKEEARQLLPLSIEVRYMLTVNAWSLAHILRRRMCYRNTIETVLCANRIWEEACEWFPDLFLYVGKPCTHGVCKEGKMRCNFAAAEQRLKQYD